MRRDVLGLETGSLTFRKEVGSRAKRQGVAATAANGHGEFSSPSHRPRTPPLILGPLIETNSALSACRLIKPLIE